MSLCLERRHRSCAFPPCSAVERAVFLSAEQGVLSLCHSLFLSVAVSLSPSSLFSRSRSLSLSLVSLYSRGALAAA